MRAFQRRSKKLREKRDAEQKRKKEAAEEYVFRYLEDQWEHRLEGRRIPDSARDEIRRDRAFQILVAKRLQGEPLSGPDLDHQPDIIERPDGSTVDRFSQAMGGVDPTKFFCLECGDEPVEKIGEKCADCRKFLGEDE